MKHEILDEIDQARKDYKKLVDSTFNPEVHVPPCEMTFAWGFNILKVQIKFQLLESPIGFPYSRVTSYLALNGKKITRKQLEAALPPVLPPLPTND